MHGQMTKLPLLLAGLALVERGGSAQFDVFDFVDPLIGSTAGGNVFSGATLPYGMAKAVPDVTGQNTGGFSTDGTPITGFSHLHDSGTGGNPSLGNFPLWPQLCPSGGETALNKCHFVVAERKIKHKPASVVSEPGYFALELTNGIKAEMTVTEHTALYQFEFPEPDADNELPMILVDLTDLWQSRQNASVQVSEDPPRMAGSGTFLPSFGAGSYELHFCADFGDATVADNGVWVNHRGGSDPKDIFVTRGFNDFFLEAGGWTHFKQPSNGKISARVGMSYISQKKACQNAEKEIPGPTYDFAGVRKAAKQEWRKKLSPISIDKVGGVSTELQKSFWSSIYRTMINPQDLTGENPLWKSSEPYFDSLYCIWDTFRTAMPLLTITDPGTVTRIIRGLLNIYEHEGWMPDCRMSHCKGWTQGGSNADTILVDAYVKNLTGGIDWELAAKAIIKDAEDEPLEWSYEGRGGLQSWKRLNYIPYFDWDYLGFGTDSRSISRTVEYAYNDFGLATLLKGLGRPASAYEKYYKRSTAWRKIYKADQHSKINGKDSGFVGFFQPKFMNGTWGYQDPIACSPLTDFCSLTSNPSATFESSIWEYQFYVPQDQSGLIQLLSSSSTPGDADAEFVKRLDYFHTSGLADIGNEPVFLTVYQYHYAGRPGKSTQRAHYYIDGRFNSTHAGIPGNDDSGAMGAFAVFSMVGLFPVAGQNVYLISAPFFEQVSFAVPGEESKRATVKTKNFDGSSKNTWIQSVKLNGKKYTKNWIGHEFFSQGGTLEITLGPKESSWGTARADRPPSWSDNQMMGMMEM